MGKSNRSLVVVFVRYKSPTGTIQCTVFVLFYTYRYILAAWI